MAIDEKERILSDMKKRGFALEIRTSEILETHGWEVSHQVFYLPSELENRTIDILAEKNVVLEPKWGFDIWLCVERKKITKTMGFGAR